MLRKKYATMWGAILWALIFIEVSIWMFIPGLTVMLQKVLHYITLPFITILCAHFYFKHDVPTIRKGMVLGFYFIIIGVLLELIITIPLFVKDFAYFMDWTLYFGFAIILATVIIYGKLKRGRKPVASMTVRTKKATKKFAKKPKLKKAKKKKAEKVKKSKRKKTSKK